MIRFTNIQLRRTNEAEQAFESYESRKLQINKQIQFAGIVLDTVAFICVINSYALKNESKH